MWLRTGCHGPIVLPCVAFCYAPADELTPIVKSTPIAPNETITVTIEVHTYV